MKTLSLHILSRLITKHYFDKCYSDDAIKFLHDFKDTKIVRPKALTLIKWRIADGIIFSY